MNLFEEQRQYIKERLADLQNSETSFDERIKKIEKLSPEEQVAIYLYDKVDSNHGVPWREDWAWIDSILKFSENRIINELKDESIWLTDEHKHYIETAKLLVRGLGVDLSLKAIDIIVPSLFKIKNKL